MCGIAGFVDLAAARARTVESERGRLKAMCDVMRYRGPDDEGFFVAPGVGLGMKPEPRYLRAGDVVELGITGLGQARQRIVEYSAIVVGA